MEPSLQHWQLPDENAEAVDSFMASHGLSRLASVFLLNRHVTPAEYGAFSNPLLADLSDPFIIPGTETAAKRLWDAIQGQQKILVHGDYDTDGITATALLAWVLQKSRANVSTYLPNRLAVGYGLTEDSVRYATESGIDLMVTVDCGITSVAAAAAAKEQGLDLIISDHHQPSDSLPEAVAIINPKLHDSLSSLHTLAGVGVAFKLCHAFIKYGRQQGIAEDHVDLKEGLDLVALGTVADIVPLTGENRCLVSHGLRTMKLQQRPGLRALCDLSGLHDSVKASDIAFRLAPRLNAAGRLGKAEDALALLSCSSMADAYQHAERLEGYNKERHALERITLDGAYLQIESIDLDARCSVVVYGEEWHQGVIGIVASRLVREFGRPAIVLCRGDNGKVHGSGRSVEGIDLVRVLDLCSQYLNRYGGHPMATGLDLDESRVGEFTEALDAAVRATCGDTMDFSPVLRLDGHAAIAELDDAFFEEISLMQPFGHGMEAPVFCFDRITPKQLIPAGQHHTRGLLEDSTGHTISFIAFNQSPDELPEPPWQVAATPQLNEFRGRATPQLQLLDVRDMH